MKKITKLLIAVLLCISFSKVDAINVSPTPGELIAVKNHFIKTDDKGNLIDNSEFKQTAINGTPMLEKITVKNDNQLSDDLSTFPNILSNGTSNGISGKYEYIDSVNDVSAAYSLLTPDQKSIMDKMTNLQYYNNIKDLISLDSDKSTYCLGKEAYVNHLKESKGIMASLINNEDDSAQTQSAIFNHTQKYNIKKLISNDENNSSIRFTILSFTFIEETKTPKGLEKANIIVPMKIYLEYKINSNNTLELVDGTAYQVGYLMIYTPEIDYSDISDVYAKMNNSLLYGFNDSCKENPTWHDYTCGNGPKSKLDKSALKEVPTVKEMQDAGALADDSCITVVIDKTSTEDLSKKVEIESFVNGKKEVNVKKNDEVTITVKVYNGSKTPLYTNKVVSKVPQDFTLVDGSILKNGTYDENTRTVTWNYDYLDSLNAELFSYKVKAPDNVKDGTSVKTSATLTTNDSTVPIVSDEATMDLGDQKTNDNITNPNTGILTEQIVSVVLSVSVLLVLLFVRKNRIQSI